MTEQGRGMGSMQSNYRRDYQSIVNNFTVKSKETCALITKSEASNNVIIVDHTKIKGDFEGVTLTASTDGTCMVVNNIQDVTDGMLKDLANQSSKASTDLFGDFTVTNLKNVSDVRQSQVNNMLNVFEGTCSSSQITATNNNFVYVTDSTIGGNFHGITNKSDNKLTCTLTNMAKMSSYNRGDSTTTQKAEVKGIAATVIVGIVVIVIVIWVGYYFMQTVSKLTYKSGHYETIPAQGAGAGAGYGEDEEEEEEEEEEEDEEEYEVREGEGERSAAATVGHGEGETSAAATVGHGKRQKVVHPHHKRKRRRSPSPSPSQVVYVPGTPADPPSFGQHFGSSLEQLSTGVGRFVGSPEGQKTIAKAVELAAV